MKWGFFLLLTLPLLGEEAGIDTSDLTPSGGIANYWGEFVHMLFTLAFVILLIGGSLWLLKKIMRSKVRALNATNGIKILEKRFLGAKTSLYLVDILGKGVVISESPTGVQLICEFPEGVAVEELLDSLQEEKQAQPTWRERLMPSLRKNALQKDG